MNDDIYIQPDPIHVFQGGIDRMAQGGIPTSHTFAEEQYQKDFEKLLEGDVADFTAPPMLYVTAFILIAAFIFAMPLFY